MCAESGMLAATDTLESVVSHAARHLPDTLVSARSWRQVCIVASRLPPVPLMALEHRVGSRSGAVDLLVAGSPAVFLASGTAAVRRIGPGWDRVTRVGRRWARATPRSLTRKGIECVWLEFDISRTHAFSPAVVFLDGFPADADLRAHVRFRRTVTALLCGPERAKMADAGMARCVGALPPGARVFSLGDMSARPGGGVRVALAGLTPATLDRYLDRISWPGSRQAVAGILALVPPAATRICVDLDITVGVGPKIGVEVYLNGRADTRAWAGLFDDLVRKDLCVPEWRDALLGWPGHAAEDTTAGMWPRHAACLRTLLGDRVACRAERSLNHIKIVHEPAHGLEVKAYLFVKLACGVRT